MTGRRPLRAAAAGGLVAVLAAGVLALDQTAKLLAIQNLPVGRTVPVLGDVLSFYLVRNPGAAFSLGTGVTWLFTIVLAAVAVVIAVTTVRSVRSRWWAVVLGLLLGGVLGNLTDRLLREPGFAVGQVVDFISTPWLVPAIYNVADTFIVTTMISVALLVILGVHMDGSRERRRGRPVKDGDDSTILGEGDEVAPEGGVQGGFDAPFPVADPDAGVPEAERGLPPLTEREQRDAEAEADREAHAAGRPQDARPRRGR